MKTVGKSNSCVYIYIKSMFLFYVIERQSKFSCGTIKRDIFSFVKCNFKKVHLEKKYTWCNVSYCDSFDHNIFFLIFFFFYWSMVGLQCCVSYCCTAEWLSYVLYIHSFSHSFPLWFITGYWYSSLCYTVGLCCLSILYTPVASANPNSQSPTSLTSLPLGKH